jgi:hypothetical protein
MRPAGYSRLPGAGGPLPRCLARWLARWLAGSLAGWLMPRAGADVRCRGAMRQDILVLQMFNLMGRMWNERVTTYCVAASSASRTASPQLTHLPGWPPGCRRAWTSR